MSAPADVVERRLPGDVPLVAVRRGAQLLRLPAFLACALLALAINYALGKEMAWDLLNYHLYAGYSALHDRFAQDYFAAGAQGYLNPYAYVPFYALVASGLPALAVASILAVLQSVILWLTFELALTVAPAGTPARRALFAGCAVAMAALNPVLLQQLGTSFTDLTTGELVLGGWLLLATAVRSPSAPRIVAAALLLGAATALKLTNAVHALSAAVLLLFLPVPFIRRFRFACAYGSALLLSFVLLAAPWAYRLEQAFGSPFFPLFNSVFHSAEFTTEPLHHLRFIPSSVAEALWRPFAMIDPWAMVHVEVRAPDSRYALLLVLTVMLLLVQLLRPGLPMQAEAAAPQAAGAKSPPSARADPRLLAALGAAFALDWVLWLSGSGNSRYFIPSACVAGVLVIALLFNLLHRRPKARNYVLVAIFATQALQVWWGGELRWAPAPWDGRWFDVSVPQALTKHPMLYLMVEARSNSFLAPYLPPDAGLIDIAGSYPLLAGGANGKRVQALIERYAPHVRLLVTGERLYADAERRSPTVSGINSTVQAYGLQVDPADCATLTVRGIASDPEVGTGLPSPLYLVSCALVPDHADHSADLARERTANLVLDRLEDACPKLFQPRRPPTGRYASMWRRMYLNTDLIAWVSKNEVKFFNPVRGDDTVYLGSESDWAQTPPRLDCGYRDGRYFARVLGSPGKGKAP
jgi:hypothetical protein